MDERIEYRGHIIFWQKPLGGAKWAAGFTSGCPSLFPAVEPIEAEAIQGHSCADMVVNAMRYIDGLLDRSPELGDRLRSGPRAGGLLGPSSVR
jgi:hypothetical protein